MGGVSTDQLALFGPYTRPRVARGDPDSSSRAADRMERSGALGRHAKLVLKMVRDFPGRTSKELGQLGALDRYQVARRLPDLLEAGLVRRTDTETECRWFVVAGRTDGE